MMKLRPRASLTASQSQRLAWNLSIHSCFQICAFSLFSLLDVANVRDRLYCVAQPLPSFFFLMPVACLLWHLILQVIQEKSPMNLFSTYLSPSSLACEARQKSLRVQWVCVCSSLVPYSFQHPSDYLFLGMVTKRHMLPSAECVALSLR